MMVGLKEDSSLLQPAFCFLGGNLGGYPPQEQAGMEISCT